MESKIRKEEFDILKAIGMLSIIIGHMGMTSISNIVYTFHVPLFFLVSGYFFKSRKELFTKRHKILLKVYLFTSVFISAIKILIAFMINNQSILTVIENEIISIAYGSGNINNQILGYTIPCVGAIWFLLALFWTDIIYFVICRYINNELYKLIITGFLFLIGVFTQSQWLPFSIQSGLIGAFFFCLGDEFKKSGIKYSTPNRFVFIAIMMALLGLWGSFKYGHLSCSTGEFPCIFVNVLGACGLTYLLLYFSRKISKYRIAKFVSFYGQNTIVILSFHLMELELFPWTSFLSIFPNRILGRLVQIFLKVVWSVFGIYIVKKFTILRSIYS